MMASSPSRRLDALAFVMLAAVVGSLISSRPAFSQSQPGAASTAQSVRELFANEASTLPLPVRQEREALQGYYVGRKGEPLWIGRQQRLNGFLQALRNAQAEGLEPSDYPVGELSRFAPVFMRLNGLDKAEIELYYSALFLRFARDLKVGRFLPNKIDPTLYWQKKTIDPVRALELLAQAPDMRSFITQWQPQIRDYAGLKTALSRFRDASEAGGWAVVPFDGVLKPGEQNSSVPALHRRLAFSDAELHGSRDRTSLSYDGELVEAVKRFQLRHGLEPDGVIGKQTLFALNIPVEDRIRQIVVNMERWRWMPEDLGQDHVFVNIAGYQLRRVRQGRVEENMRVVVGKPYHQTPVFSDEIEYLEFNPYWNVPYSIAVKEELPKLRADAAARAARGFEAVVDGRAVALTSIDWNRVSASNFAMRLRQKPGPDNALGRVKFMFPNRFNVYLHDTPARSLFGRAQRAFSHGCIRLARPLDLAEQLLRAARGWDRARIDEVLASDKRTVVRLAERLPVHLTYATVWLDENGLVHFRPDIYARDAKLEKALAGRYSAS